MFVQLKELNVVMKVAWIPGHCGLTFNEMADKEAKMGAQRVPGRETEGKFAVSPGELRERIAKAITGRWANCWKRATSGHFTKELLPVVGKQIFLPKKRTVAMTKIRGLLNNAAVADNLYRFGFVDSPNCSCEEGRETVEHVFLSCRKNESQRSTLIEEVGKLWCETRRSGNLNICLQLLLAPNFHHLITMKEAVEVEELVTRFIESAEIYI